MAHVMAQSITTRLVSKVEKIISERFAVGVTGTVCGEMSFNGTLSARIPISKKMSERQLGFCALTSQSRAPLGHSDCLSLIQTFEPVAT
jgi:hypothetical protein